MLARTLARLCLFIESVPKNGACSLFRTQSEGKEVKQIPEGKSKYDESTPCIWR
jgi:hypothetical protein